MYNSSAKIRRHVIVRRTTYQELWKGLYVNCCTFFYEEHFVGRTGIMLLNVTPFLSPCLKKPERENLEMEKTCGTASGPCKPVFWVFTAWGTKCAFILVVVRPTVMQSSVHTEFFSFVRFSPLRLLQRRKWTKFSWVFVRTWRGTKAKLVNNKS